MSVVLVCPSCAEPYTLHRPPVLEVCDRCHAPFPDLVRRVAEQSLRADATPRPLLLTLGLGFTALWASCATLVLLVALVGNMPLNANGRRVSKSEFFSDPMVLSFAPIIVLTALVAWALWRERPWTRPVMLALWVVVGVPSIFERDADWTSRMSSILFVVIGVGVASLYLYGRSNVVAYYERLAQRDALRADD